MTKASRYALEIVETICDGLMDGRSLRAICRDKDMPARSTVMQWLADRKDFQRQYALAREIQADMLFDEILDIADAPINRHTTRTTADGRTEIIRGDAIEHRRLQIDARKWVVARLKPKKYGDRMTQELTGVEGAPLVPILTLTVASTSPG